jgi:hypothetical protein
MKAIALTLVTPVLMYAAPALAGKTCDPEVSKPCGKICISKDLDCHKPFTTAKMGKPGRSTKKVYEKPELLTPEEYNKRTKED